MNGYQQHEQLEAINGYVNGNLSEEKAFDIVRDMQPSLWQSMYGFEYEISSSVYTLHKKNGKTIDVCRLALKTWGSPERVFEEKNRCLLRDEEIEYITDKNGEVVDYQFSLEKRIEKYKKNMEDINESLQRCEWDNELIRKYHYGDEEAIQRYLAENEEKIKYYKEIKTENEKILINIVKQ